MRSTASGSSPLHRSGFPIAKTTHALGLLLLLLGPGCARLAQRQLPPQAIVANFGPHALEDLGLKEFMEQHLPQPLEEWPLREWNYHRLTLAVWYFHPSLDVARERSLRAEAEFLKTAERPNRTERAAGSHSGGILPDPSELSAHAAEAGLPGLEPRSPPNSKIKPLDAKPSKRTRRIARAQRLAESARLQLETCFWQLRASVRTNLLAYVSAQRAETLLEELEGAYIEIVRSGELRVATGSLSRLELSLLRLQLSQTRLALIRTRLAKMDYRQRLANSMALPASALLEVEVTYDFSRTIGSGLTWRDLQWQALHERPDILDVLADYAFAERALRAELAKRDSHCQYSAGVRWNQVKNRWVVDLQVGSPAGQENAKAVARAEARRIAMAARLLSLQSEIIDELENGELVYRVTAAEVAGVGALVAAILREYAAVQGQFKAGIAEGFELLMARLQLTAAGLANLEAQVKLQHALGSVEDAVQLPAELLGQANRF